MKHFKITATGVLLIVMLFNVNAFAQRGYGRAGGNGQGYFCNNIPNLTADQQTKITSMRTAHWKKMQESRNLLALKRAKLQTLRSSGDINAINKIIDDMSAIRTKMQKNREQHFQNVRNILNEDQKIYFDNFSRGKGRYCSFGRAYGAGNGTGYGQGYGRGRGRCGRSW